MQPTQPPAANNPVPAASSISPLTILAGAAAFQLVLTGSSFISGSVVRWNGSDRPTTFADVTHLTAQISAADVAQAGVAQITVFNPAPGGGVSAVMQLTIMAAVNPAPSLSSLNPASIYAGSGSTTLMLNGADFTPSSTVQLNGHQAYTTYISATQLQTLLYGTDLMMAGQFDVKVFTGTPGGGTSSRVTLPVIPGATSAGPIDIASLVGDPKINLTALIEAITPDGRFIVFDATPGSPGGYTQVFVRDTCLGASSCNPTTTLISAADDGTPSAIGAAGGAISADGRIVAFVSNSTNLLANVVPKGQYVFLHNRDVSRTGVFDQPGNTQNVLVSAASDGTPANLGAFAPTTSADGRYVAFESGSDNLVSGDTNGFIDIFIRDTCIGAAGACSPSTARVSLKPDGTQIAGVTVTGSPSASVNPSISATGRYVAFDSDAIDVVPGFNAGGVFVRDTCLSAPVGCTPTTVGVSVSSTGTLSSGAVSSISGNGRFVAFVSGKLVSPVEGQSVYVRDTCLGTAGNCVPGVMNISVGPNGELADAASYVPAISSDGRFVAFQSDATNLAANNLHDTNRQSDFFVRDMCTGAPAGCVPQTFQVSVAADGTQSSGDQGIESVRVSSQTSVPGPVVVFSSSATNLVPGAIGTNVFRVIPDFK
ncbi:MAG: hypothetical protein ACRD3E_18610 [Terriglobales bacterium]